MVQPVSRSAENVLMVLLRAAVVTALAASGAAATAQRPASPLAFNHDLEGNAVEIAQRL